MEFTITLTVTTNTASHLDIERSISKALLETSVVTAIHSVQIQKEKETPEAPVAFVPLRHIRYGVTRADKRIKGSRGHPGHTACGAEITGYDLKPKDSLRMTVQERRRWNVCSACLSTPAGKL